jgi:hypothetical protein
MVGRSDLVVVPGSVWNAGGHIIFAPKKENESGGINQTYIRDGERRDIFHDVYLNLTQMKRSGQTLNYRKRQRIYDSSAARASQPKRKRAATAEGTDRQPLHNRIFPTENKTESCKAALAEKKDIRRIALELQTGVGTVLRSMPIEKGGRSRPQRANVRPSDRLYAAAGGRPATM